MLDFVFLSVANSPYVPIVEKLVSTLNNFHSEIDLHLVCVNMKDSEIQYLKSLHSNLHPIIVNKTFKKLGGSREMGPLDSGHEEGYCTSCRSWFMLDIMKKYNKSVFYLDADVYLKDDISGLFPKLQEADFMIRAKNLNKDTFKCNAGMVWLIKTKILWLNGLLKQ